MNARRLSLLLSPVSKHTCRWSYHVVMCLLLFVHSMVRASGVIVTPYAAGNPFVGFDYATKASLFRAQMQSATGYETQVQIASDFIRSARHAGARRLERMFKNFGPGSYVDFSDPGVIRAITRLGVLNKAVVEGASRELVYYQRLYNNPFLFSDVRIDVPVQTSSGHYSDIDIYYYENFSGRNVWLEVKNNRSLHLTERHRSQLERMSQFRGRRIVICRHRVTPAFRKYANDLGIEVFDGVRSQEILRTLASREILAMRISGALSIVGGVAATSYGLYSMYNRLDAVNWRVSDYVARGMISDALLSLTGITQTTYGYILLKEAGNFAHMSPANLLSETDTALLATSRAFRWAKGMGRAGTVFVVLLILWETYRVYEGDVAPRTGIAQVSGLAGGFLLGLFGGAKLGALGGSLIGPWGTAAGTVIGGIVGGLIGYFGGKYISSRAYDYFVFSDEEFARRKLEILEASLIPV